MESRIVLETGQQEKLYPPTDVNVWLQCRPQLLLVNFENLAHKIFRNKSSTLEINVSHFGVLHWRQWQPPASAPSLSVNLLPLHLVRKILRFLVKILKKNLLRRLNLKQKGGV